MSGIKKVKPIITLDDYVDFFLAQKQFDLTVNQFNQIIQLHGFKAIHRSSKKYLIDAVDKLDLMDPSRSTLGEHISSCASMSLDNIMNDLNLLNWQDTGVVSVCTLNSSKDENCGSTSLSVVIKTKPRTEKTRRNNDCYPSVCPKSKPKMKRKKKKGINGCDLNEGIGKLPVPKRNQVGSMTPGNDGVLTSEFSLAMVEHGLVPAKTREFTGIEMSSLNN